MGHQGGQERESADRWTYSGPARADQGPRATFVSQGSRLVRVAWTWNTNEPWASSREQRWGIVGASCGVALGDLR